MRGIQYAGASRFKSLTSGILGHPPTRVTTTPRGAASRRNRAVGADCLRMAVVVDRNVRKVAVGDEDRLLFLAAQHPGFEMDGDRGAADLHNVGMHGDEIADIDR